MPETLRARAPGAAQRCSGCLWMSSSSAVVRKCHCSAYVCAVDIRLTTFSDALASNKTTLKRLCARGRTRRTVLRRLWSKTSPQRVKLNVTQGRLFSILTAWHRELQSSIITTTYLYRKCLLWKGVGRSEWHWNSNFEWTHHVCLFL